MMRKGGETARGGEDSARRWPSLSQSASRRSSATHPTSSSSTLGKRPFRSSVFTAKPFGKIVICAGTTGIDVDFNVARALDAPEKEILGSHFANAYECTKANELIESGVTSVPSSGGRSDSRALRRRIS